MNKNKRRNLFVLVGIALAVILVSLFFYLGCQTNTKPNLANNEEAATYFLKLIKEQNYQELSQNISQNGLRLATSPYLSAENIVLTPSQVSQITTNNSQFTFGQSDGSGESINLTVKAFFERYVYPHDYLAIDQTNLANKQSYQSSTLNNIQETYPTATIKSYIFPGSSEFGNMDWQKLNLVIEAEPKAFKLKALINEEWTI